METVTPRSACERLCIDFAHYVDHRHYEQLAELFSEDGTFTREGKTLHGYAQILAAMRARPPEIDTRHLCTNVRVEVLDEHRATGTCYLLLVRVHAGQAPQSPVFAQFHDHYRLTLAGWRIASRTVVVPL